MRYKCTILKSFQSLPVGATATLSEEAYKRRLAAGEVRLKDEVVTIVDESLIEDDGIHSDNVSDYTAAEEPEDKPVKKKRTSFFKK